MEPNNDKAPLTTISQSGTYKLKLIRPKGTDKVKVWEDGTASCRLFFLDDKGFSNNFTNEIRMDATPAEFLQYLDPACGKTCLIGVEVSQAKDKAGNPKVYNGEPVWSYKFVYPKGSQKPTVAEPTPENPPF
jgi:hypothetical protein